MDGQSLNIPEERIQQLRQIFPDCFSEGKVDFQRLKAALGEDVLFPGEHYELSWAGKADARREVQRQTTATLIPDPDGSFPPHGGTESEVSPLSFGGGAGGGVFIEGENLEVLRVLQKSYFGKVKMIYIDPPYNTGSDSFVYPDDFSERQEDYLRRTGAKDEAGYLNKQDLWKKNTKENGQFHSAWMSMMYPRLYLARNLLREDGVIFVSIDDNEVANLRLLMDEVFGEENFVAQLVWERGRKNDAKLFSIGHEYVLVYSKFKDSDTVWREEKPGAREILAEYLRLKDELGSDYQAIQKGIRSFYENLAEKDKKHPALKHRRYNRIDENGIWRDDNISWPGGNGPKYDVIHPITGLPCKVPDGGWRFSTTETFNLYVEHGFIFFREDHTEPPMLKRYLNYVSTDFAPDTKRRNTSQIEGEEEVNVQVMPSVFYKNAQPVVLELRALMGADIFQNPKDPEILRRWISYVTTGNDLILDFFAGSGTTAQAVMELNAEDGGNRRFILVQMPEPLEENSEAWKVGYRSIADIGRARVRKVIQRLQAAAAEKAKTPGLFEASENKAGQVLGFQSYRLQYSNFKVWRNDVEGKGAILNQLQMFQEPLAEYRGAHSALLTELLLKAGFPLTVEVAEKTVDGCPVFEVDGGRMWVALDNVTAAVFQAAAAARPAVFVTLSGLFAGGSPDETMANAHLQLKDAGVDFKVI